MGSKSNYLENAVLDHVLGSTSYTKPATVYIALFTTSPGEAGGGVEVSGGSYARCTVTNNATNWPAASGGSKSNGAAFTFTAATALWGTIAGFAIMDASTSGNMLYYGDLSTPKTIDNGDTFSFAIGDIVITED